MNIARLKRLESFFRESPETVNMNNWGQTRANPNYQDDYIVLRDVGALICHAWERDLADVKCDTLACIAGWAVLLFWAKRPPLLRQAKDTVKPVFTEIPRNQNIPDLACTLLELDERERYRLFFLESWPESWQMAYRLALPSRRGIVVADYITAFIENNGMMEQSCPPSRQARCQETYL